MLKRSGGNQKIIEEDEMEADTTLPEFSQLDIEKSLLMAQRKNTL